MNVKGKVEITKEIVTETSHRLYDYKGKCNSIHGHSYRWQVTVGLSPIVNKLLDGMVMDFGDLKNAMKDTIERYFDHKLILNKRDEKLFVAIREADPSIDLVLFDFNPTAENFATFAAGMLISKLESIGGDHLRLISVKCWETETSFAEWRNNDE